MLKSYKVRLEPNNKQQTKMWKAVGTARFAYNWCLARQKENYDSGGKFISDGELGKELTKLKSNELSWMSEVSAKVPKQAVKDCCESFKKFFNGKSKYPKFKSRKKSKPSFYQRCDQIRVVGGKICLEKIGYVRMSEKDRIPIVDKYYNPRVTHDGLHWYISVSVEVDAPYVELSDEVIGVDLGIKDLAILDDGTKYENINKSVRVKKLSKALKRKQRQISRKYENNKKGGSYHKTKNIVKAEREALVLRRKIANIQADHIQKVTTEIVNRKPRLIVLEDLNIKGMLKNRKLSRAIQEQSLRKFDTVLCGKSFTKGIAIKRVDRFYPSSKLCSECGTIKTDLKLSDRVYRCACGAVVDRDINAARNLRNFGIV